MKNINIILAAAAAAFALAACDKAAVEEAQEESVQANDNIKINITVADYDTTSKPSGVATKAVKTGWASGDQINIWYDTNIQQKPDLVIKYDGSKWEKDASASVSGNSPAASGTLNAMYVEGGMSNAFSSYYDMSSFGQFNFSASSTEYDGLNYPKAIHLLTYIEKAAYTYSSETLTATLDAWTFKNANNVQVVITDLPSSDYALSCDKFLPKVGFVLNSDGSVGGAGGGTGDYVLPVSNADGFAFLSDFKGSDTDFTFTLCNAAGTDKRTYTVSGKTLDKTGNKLNAIKIPFSKFSKAVDYIEIGHVKWATMNVGATTVAGSPATCFGDYFAWGETSPRYTGITISSDGCSATFAGWSESHGSGYSDGDSPTYTGETLDAAHDAATANWGASWRTPTYSDFEALCSACDVSMPAYPSDLSSSNPGGGMYWLSADQDYILEYTGISGVLFVDQSNTSKRIFFPASGYIWDKDFWESCTDGKYWTSYQDDNGPHNLYFKSYDSDLETALGRNLGYTVRPVVAE